MKRIQEVTELGTHALTTYFLTGATGLLGRFILARLLRLGCRVVVLVRDTPLATARQRIEQCLQPFEQHTYLARPEVVAGSLNQPQLGMSVAAIESLATTPLRVIHCAASIRFVAQGESDEPYATNVIGTRYLLDLLRDWQVVDFHHVSTAYVGVRRGIVPVPEDWVPTPDLGGNDYERSKIQAENLVQACPWLSSRVIHRPSIIIGDSQSGFTSTYHGFYAPLQIGAQYARRFGLNAQAADLFRQHLGIGQQDTKNLIPVDWVADAIAAVATTPVADSDRILHWTNPRPVLCSEMQSAIMQTLGEFFGRLTAGDPVALNAQTPTDEMVVNGNEFRQQMQVYESYFGADPAFERGQAEQALHSAEYAVSDCPVVDGEVLRRMGRFAVEHQFGWPKPALPSPPNSNVRQVLDVLGAVSQADSPAFSLADSSRAAVKNPESIVQIDVLGPWAPARMIWGCSSKEWFRLPPGTQARKCWIVPMDQLVACIIGKRSAIELIEQGYWVIRSSRPGGCLEIVNDWVKDVSSRIASAEP